MAGRSEEAQQEVAAAVQGRRLRGVEDVILRIENQLPGFGGVFEGTDGKLVVYLEDPSQQSAALGQLRDFAAALSGPREFRMKLGQQMSTTVRQADFAFSDLVVWQRAVALAIRGLGAIAIDADEALNRVRVSIPEGASRSAFITAIAASGVPESAVVLETGVPVYSAWTVRDRVRPITGGQQIFSSDYKICTLGFNVDVYAYNQKGFLTAGHCAAGTTGIGNSGSSIYQPSVAIGNIIGTESLNPAWNRTDFECDVQTLCTGADAMYVEASSYSSANWAARYAKPNGVGINNAMGSITIQAYWQTIEVVPFTYVGASVDKVGRTTGGTRGTITASCENPVVNPGRADEYRVLCADKVETAAAGRGDSGAGVYYPEYSGPNGEYEPFWAIGILFARGGTTIQSYPDGTDRCTSGCRYYYSPWPAIEAHLSRYFLP